MARAGAQRLKTDWRKWRGGTCLGTDPSACLPPGIQTWSGRQPPAVRLAHVTGPGRFGDGAKRRRLATCSSII